MPNWAYTEIIVRNKEEIEELRKVLTEDGENVDFNRLVPMPELLEYSLSPMDFQVMAYYLMPDGKVKTDEEIDKMVQDMVCTIKNPVNTTLPKERELLFGGLKPINPHQILRDFVHNPLDFEKERESFMKRLERHKEFIERTRIIPESVKALDSPYEYGKAMLYAHLAYGDIEWYAWANRYWGTKWNGTNTDWDLSNNFSVRFDTAWSPPYPVVLELSKQVSFPFYIRCAEEQFDCFAYEAITHKGKFLKEAVYSNEDANEKATLNMFKIASSLMDGEQIDHKWDKKKGEIVYSCQAEDPDYIEDWDEIPALSYEELKTDMLNDFLKE